MDHLNYLFNGNFITIGLGTNYLTLLKEDVTKATTRIQTNLQEFYPSSDRWSVEKKTTLRFHQ